MEYSDEIWLSPLSATAKRPEPFFAIAIRPYRLPLGISQEEWEVDDPDAYVLRGAEAGLEQAETGP